MIINWIPDTPIPSAWLSRMQIAADLTLWKEGIIFPCCVSVRLCDDTAIQQLNAQWRGIDRSTDVLSFPSVRWPKGMTAGLTPKLLKSEYDEFTGACFLGDVIISTDHLRAQAREFGHSEDREAAYLLVHSLCHLMGYDHMEEGEKRRMRQKEEEILSSCGISRDDGSVRVADDDLIHLAREAMSRSYSPYSHFPVGAALHATDGRIFQGCNIENASFGATICAERTAMAKAVSEGAREFDVIAISTLDEPGWPCGICRQFMSEFAPNIRIIVTWGKNGEQKDESTLEKMLTHQFRLNS